MRLSCSPTLGATTYPWFMAFVDECMLYVISGRGGDGSASMHSEPYKSRGGPDGGNGGDGGSGILEVQTGGHDPGWPGGPPHPRGTAGRAGRSATGARPGGGAPRPAVPRPP